MPFPIAVLAVGAVAAAAGAFLLGQKKTKSGISPLPTGQRPLGTAPSNPRPTGTTGFAPPQPAFKPSAAPAPAPAVFTPPQPAFVPPPPAPTFSPSSASGGGINRSSTEYKKWLQAALNQVNAAGLVVDGAIGPKSIAAIKAYQSKRGLSVDGVPGPQTEGALMKDGAPNPPGFAGIRPEPQAIIVDLDSPTIFDGPSGGGVITLPTVDVTAGGGFTPPSIPSSLRSTSGYKKWVQASLNTVDPPSPLLTVDGAIGPKSIAAIKHFQGSKGLSADGVMGPKTEGALMLALFNAGAAAITPPGA